ncbi:cyclase family protein [Glycomyces tarimensis]
MTEYRVSFDAAIGFRNGGGMTTEGFRLDVPGPNPSESEVADLLVRHLGLLMVERVEVRNLEVFTEAHKGSRGGPSDPERAPVSTERRLVELSHVITPGMTTYPGLPGPEITPHLTREDSRGHYAPGTEFAIDRISMVGNTGTYLDSPFHRYADGTDLAGLDLSKVADLAVTLIDLTGSRSRAITAEAVAAYDIEGRAVLLYTGWDRHWGTERYLSNEAPYLDEPGARRLVEAGAALVGIDSVNIDDTSGTARPAHSLLLEAEIPVLEHLTGLDQLPLTGARLHAAPPLVRDFGTFPVRAYAVIGE